MQKPDKVNFDKLLGFELVSRELLQGVWLPGRDVWRQAGREGRRRTDGCA